jgi:hypothetical protein
MQKQGRKAPLELESDERSLGVERGLILSKIANTPAPVVRQPEDVAALLEGLVETYWALELKERNELARALCQTLGSHPRVNRDGRKSTTISLTWPELAAFEVSYVSPTSASAWAATSSDRVAAEESTERSSVSSSLAWRNDRCLTEQRLHDPPSRSDVR